MLQFRWKVALLRNLRNVNRKTVQATDNLSDMRFTYCVETSIRYIVVGILANGDG